MNTVLLAVLNTMWQSVALVAAVWLLLKFVRGTNAATRHALWWAVLAVVILLPVVPAHIPATGPDPLPAMALVAVPDEAQVVAPSPSVAAPPARSALELPAGDWPAWILGAWMLACLVQLGRTAWSYRYLRLLKREARPAAPELRRNFDAWMMSCGVRRPVRLLVSSRIASPMAIGFREPAVVLPESLLEQFREAELDHVLLHELAHMTRRDDWSNLAARLAGAVLVFHPAALWILRRIDREREISCDDWVVAMTGSARPYATSLTRLFELCRGRNRLLLASGMATRASQLGERIELLLRGKREFTAKASAPRVAFAVLAVVAAGMAFAQAPHWLAFAQDVPPAPPVAPLPPEPPAPPEAPASPEAPAPPAPPAAPAPPAPPAPPAAPAPSAAPQAPLPPQPPAPATPPSPPAPPAGGFLAALVASGYGSLPVDQIIELKNAGISSRFLTGMAQAGWGHPSVPELIELGSQGVSPEYAHAMRDAGLRGLTLKDVIQLRIHGARPDNFREIHSLGFGPYTPAEAIDFTIHGVPPELFRAFKDAGWKDVPARDVLDAQLAGLRASDLREARQYGSNLTLKQIVRLKQAGVI